MFEFDVDKYPRLSPAMRKGLQDLTQAIYDKTGRLRWGDTITHATHGYNLLRRLPSSIPTATGDRPIDDRDVLMWLNGHAAEKGYLVFSHPDILPTFNNIIDLSFPTASSSGSSSAERQETSSSSTATTVAAPVAASSSAATPVSVAAAPVAAPSSAAIPLSAAVAAPIATPSAATASAAPATSSAALHTPAAAAAPTSVSSLSSVPHPAASPPIPPSLFDAKKSCAEMTRLALGSLGEVLNLSTFDTKYAADRTGLDKLRTSLRALKENAHNPKAVNDWHKVNKAIIDKFVAENPTIPQLQAARKQLEVLSNLEMAPITPDVKADLKPFVDALKKVHEEESKRPLGVEGDWEKQRNEMLHFFEAAQSGGKTLAQIREFILKQKMQMESLLLKESRGGSEKEVLTAQWKKLLVDVEKDYVKQYETLASNPIGTLVGSGVSRPGIKLSDVFLEDSRWQGCEQQVNDDNSVTLIKGSSRVTISENSIKCDAANFELALQALSKFPIITYKDCSPAEVTKLKEVAQRLNIKIMPAAEAERLSSSPTPAVPVTPAATTTTATVPPAATPTRTSP